MERKTSFWCGQKGAWTDFSTKMIPQIKVQQKGTYDTLSLFQHVKLATDFVRKEYALAMKLKKNVVPVAHEEFDWPDRSRLPKDCDAVMGLNAVKYACTEYNSNASLSSCGRFRNAHTCQKEPPHFTLRYNGEFRDASILKIKDALQGCTFL